MLGGFVSFVSALPRRIHLRVDRPFYYEILRQDTERGLDSNRVRLFSGSVKNIQ